MAQVAALGVLLFLVAHQLCLASDIAEPILTENRHTVCFGELGCFSSLPPFHPDMPLPLSPKRLNTKFYLYTRQNREPEEGYFLEPKEKNIMASQFDPTLKTKIIIHGFVITNTELASWVMKVTHAILDKEDVNVIVVNWIDGARLTYDQAVSNTRVVGSQIGHLIKNLMEYHNAKTDDFHIIGFSLGAHVAGFTGKSVKSGTNNIIGRITGLDPANPGFNYDSAVVRLDKSDAAFVDVIHTDTSTLLFTASGIRRNIGHADYYPNGGESQPGCSGDIKNDHSAWLTSVAELTVCDHLRAPRLFMNSINMTRECTFNAYRCQSYEKFKQGKCIRCGGGDKGGRNRCSVMGYWAQKPHTKKQVQYYLQTTAAAPFCVKNYQVQFHWRKSHGSTAAGFNAKLFVTLIGDKGSTAETALNDGTTYHVRADNTTRFLATVGCEQDIGNVREVVFRWERPKCWWWSCSKENIYLRRIKIVDGSRQKRYMFVPVRDDGDANKRQRIIEVLSDKNYEFRKKSWMRKNTITSNDLLSQLVQPALTLVNPNSRIKSSDEWNPINRRLRKLNHKHKTETPRST